MTSALVPRVQQTTLTFSHAEVFDIDNSTLSSSFPPELELFPQITGLTLSNLTEDPRVQAYRRFYHRTLRIDPTKIRPSAEALTRRYLRSGRLPAINAVVNAYNSASVLAGISIGAYDLKSLCPPFELRNPLPEETLEIIGRSDAVSLRSDMILLADLRGPFCLLPYRDSRRTCVSTDTTEVVLMALGVEGIDQNDVQYTVDLAADLIITAVGGSRTPSAITQVTI